MERRCTLYDNARHVFAKGRKFAADTYLNEYRFAKWNRRNGRKSSQQTAIIESHCSVNGTSKCFMRQGALCIRKKVSAGVRKTSLARRCWKLLAIHGYQIGRRGSVNRAMATGTVQPWDPALRIPRSLKEPALYSLFDCRSLQSSLNNCFLLSCLRGPANDTHYAWRWLLGPASLASLRLPSCIVHLSLFLLSSRSTRSRKTRVLDFPQKIYGLLIFLDDKSWWRVFFVCSSGNLKTLETKINLLHRNIQHAIGIFLLTLPNYKLRFFQ